MHGPHLQADPSVQMLMYVFAVCGLSSLSLLLICSLCCYFCHRREAQKEEGVTTADSTNVCDVFYRKKGKSPLSAPTITSQADLFSRGAGPPSYTLDSLREREITQSFSPAFLSFTQRLHSHFAATTEEPKSISPIEAGTLKRYDSLVPQENAYLHTRP
ncbi:hypothetical protein BIW11_14142 [Tropilaelaps mercedesae]|uniref:Uncharacterized protein n=1 Tax=Tropilaelaps mercedesae TaxID=418985 RepID=A0A1V9WZA8_9ACAR|nr:hypothetical protein BIW11_14142 [Tropilaelaps mercedesae]